MGPLPRVENVDWLEGVRSLAPGAVDLVYADPPFNTGRAQRTPGAAGRVRGRDVHASYADSWESMESYASWLRVRLLATRPALAPTGAVMIHCDARACHYVRLVMDEVFGAECFVNHLVWSYGLGGSSPRGFARKHDDIIFYSAAPDRHYFDPPRVPATSRRLRGQTKKATDVLDIPVLNNMSRERTGYPTQKPLALLEMLVRSACPEGGLVLDPCCGSGTTLVAAMKTGRRAVGFDVSPGAVRTATDRARSAAAASE